MGTLIEHLWDRFVESAEAAQEAYYREMAEDIFRTLSANQATGGSELSTPQPHADQPICRGDPGEDPKGEGDSPTRRKTQGEQYPGTTTRSTSAGLASDVE